MISTLETLKSRFQAAAEAAYGVIDVDPVLVEATRPEFGDFQYNGVMALAKSLKLPPRQVAQGIVANLALDDICHTPDIAGPGFINLKLKVERLETELQSVASDDRLGIPLLPMDKVIVDYSSPNIAKEMHVGHLRTTVIGESLARILEFLGYDVLRLNHIGDWGTGFGMLIAFLQDAHPEALTDPDSFNLGDLTAFYKRAKLRFDEDPEFKERARLEVVKLQGGDPDSLYAWKIFCDQSRKACNEIYDLLDVHLVERGESFYNPYLPAVVEDLRKVGLLTTHEGAECVFVPGFTNREGEPLPLIVRKSDGGYNYATTDLAAVRYRLDVDGARRVIYVVDIGQREHFAQVFATAGSAGWVPDGIDLVHVPFGLVLGPDGKKFKTRSGDTVRLRDLLDEAITRARDQIGARVIEEGRSETEEFLDGHARTVGIAAIKYAELSQNRLSDYVFSFDKMFAMQGNTAPYMLYAYARVQGIYRKGDVSSVANEEKRDNRLDASTVPIKFHLGEPSELALAKHLLRLDETIIGIATDFLPNRLCQYLFELSQKFNVFYECCSVLGAEEALRTSRLGLSSLTARTLHLGLSLLGIPTVERL